MNIRLQNDKKPEDTPASSDIPPQEEWENPNFYVKPEYRRKKRSFDFPGWGFIYKTVAPVLWILIVLYIIKAMG